MPTNRFAPLLARTRWNWAAAMLLFAPSHPLLSQAAQTPSRAPDTLRVSQFYRATVLSVDTLRILLSAPTKEGTREVHLPARVLRPLAALRGRTFAARAEERPTPAGLRSAVVLRDGATVRAVAESIRDLQILLPIDRGGIQVEQRPAQNRKLLYENECRTVYNVATAFTIGGETVVLQPYETRTVTVGGATYTISLAASQFFVPKECKVVFEGSRSLIEYVIMRT